MPASFGAIEKGLPSRSPLNVSAPKPAVSPPYRPRRIPARLNKPKHLNPNQTLFTVKRLKRDAQHSESYVTQLFESYQEHKHSQDELARFRDIRKHLKADALLDHLSNSHGLVRDNYRQFRAKDGSARIQAGKRGYNVSDFCTQHMGMSWEETKPLLKHVYGQQRQREMQKQRARQERQAVNAIVFVSNQVTQGWKRASPLDDTIRLLRHLQRKEHHEGSAMLSALERYRTPETTENAIHSAKEEFSLTESAKRIRQARETAARITLTMNDLVASKNEEKQFVEFLDKNTGDKVFRDNGEKIVMRSRQPDLNHTAVALTLAAEKYGVVKITGNKAFKQQVLDVAVSKDLNIVFADKAMEAEFIRRKEELKQAATAESAKVQASASPSAGDESNAMVKSSAQATTDAPTTAPLKGDATHVEPVTLVNHGPAPYQHKEGNAASYFVALSNGETKWGVKLKDAIEESGAKIGDEVSVSKAGAKDVEVQVQKEDEQGNKLPPETIETKRNEWVIEVLRSTVEEKVQAEPTQEHIDKLVELKGRDVAQAVAETTASDVLKPTTFAVDYGWDKLSGKTSVTINGESPNKFEKATVERIIRNDAFLKHYSVDDVQFGLLDRKKAKDVQPVPKTYDVNAKVMEEVSTEASGMKLK